MTIIRKGPNLLKMLLHVTSNTWNSLVNSIHIHHYRLRQYMLSNLDITEGSKTLNWNRTQLTCLTKVAVLAGISMPSERSVVRWVPKCSTDSVKQSLPQNRTPILAWLDLPKNLDWPKQMHELCLVCIKVHVMRISKCFTHLKHIS